LVLAQESVKGSGPAAQEVRKLLTAPQIAEGDRQIQEWLIAHPPR